MHELRVKVPLPPVLLEKMPHLSVVTFSVFCWLAQVLLTAFYAVNIFVLKVIIVFTVRGGFFRLNFSPF